MIYKIKQFDEGINDKNLFKAVFLAGGAGSGKSFIVQQAYGVGAGNITAFGAKVINSDFFFEKGLEELGLPFEIDMSKPEIYAQQSVVRDWAKGLADNKQALHVNGMLPLIIDGTGRDAKKIIRQSDVLKSIGYDVSMLFVNTHLDVALKRNADRKRTVDPDFVEKMWYDVQGNIGAFQQYFGKYFDIIDNNKYYPLDSPEFKKFADMLYKIGRKHIEEPLRNYKGLQILNTLRETGGKYLSDLVKE
jgi:hypothetical protein